MSENMQCDICKVNDFNEVIILRKQNFTKNGYTKVHRVCFSCARDLTKKHIYDFGNYWRGLFDYAYIGAK